MKFAPMIDAMLLGEIFTVGGYEEALRAPNTLSFFAWTASVAHWSSAAEFLITAAAAFFAVFQRLSGITRAAGALTAVVVDIPLVFNVFVVHAGTAEAPWDELPSVYVETRTIVGVLICVLLWGIDGTFENDGLSGI